MRAMRGLSSTRSGLSNNSNCNVMMVLHARHGAAGHPGADAHARSHKQEGTGKEKA
ncbi:hypothetical protein JCM14635_12000 [Megalodesulfovibrio paquesii]